MQRERLELRRDYAERLRLRRAVHGRLVEAAREPRRAIRPGQLSTSSLGVIFRDYGCKLIMKGSKSSVDMIGTPFVPMNASLLLPRIASPSLTGRTFP